MESYTFFALLALLVPHQRHRTLLITIVESLTCVDTDVCSTYYNYVLLSVQYNEELNVMNVV